MNTKTSHSRRNFIKAGAGMAASIASLGAAASMPQDQSVDSSIITEPTSKKDSTEWVGAGYLMARPVTKNPSA